jgi:hypothetical protein
MIPECEGAPDSSATIGVPGQVCPDCQMSLEHETGCPYEGVSIAEAVRIYGATTSLDSGDENVERITVNLIARTSQALMLAVELTGDSKTDTINRALQIYAFLAQATAHGGSVYVQEGIDSELMQLKIF